ncbi:MAG TPA: YjgN family protein [Dongiaceae bacterium]|nr:YjgN family protein [Dongiaceae bacterium]
MNDKGGVVAAASWPGAGQPMQKLEYDGTIGALYWIFIKNLLLNIITLTIYRFWGKTNLRRYAWSHTTLQGERFEYTGRGGELFLGFLVVVGFYAVGAIVFLAATLAFGTGAQVIGKLAVGVLIVYFIFVAQYAAQNYRLTRTLWSGIQGGMTGSAWRYGVKAFLLTLLNIVTLNLATPWVTLRLAEERFNNSYLGNAKASLQASAKPLYSSFILGLIFTIIGVIVLLAVWGGMVYAALVALDMMPMIEQIRQAQEMGVPANLSEEQQEQLIAFIVGFGILFYLGLVLVGIAAFAPYMAALFRAIANNLQLAELRFASEVTAWRYIRLWVGNLLWVVLTLGLGFPVAVHRSIRFFADRVTIHGELDVGRLQQTTLDRPKFGEGLLEAFDPGFF